MPEVSAFWCSYRERQRYCESLFCIRLYWHFSHWRAPLAYIVKVCAQEFMAGGTLKDLVVDAYYAGDKHMKQLYSRQVRAGFKVRG